MKRSSLILCLILPIGVALASAADTKKSSHYAGTTLTGCLTAGSDAKSFVLTNATLPDGKAAAADRWDLTAAATLKLADHVGHKVEVKGKEGTDHKLQVHSLKHVSPTCP